MQNKLICPQCHYQEDFNFTFETIRITCPKCKTSFISQRELDDCITRPIALSMVDTDTAPTTIKNISEASKKLKESLECDLRAINLINESKKLRLQHNHEFKLTRPVRRQNSFVTYAQQRWLNRFPWITVALIVVFVFICGLYLGLFFPNKL